MKVGLLIPAAPNPFGGTSSFANGLAKALAQQRVETKIFATTPALGWLGAWDLSESLVWDPTIIEQIAEFDPDIIHANANWRLAAVRFPLRRSGWNGALVFTFHTAPAGRVVILRRGGMAKVLRRTDVLTAVSSSLRTQAEATLGGRVRVKVVYPGIEPPSMDPPERLSRSGSRHPDRVIIGTVSNMAWRKKVRGLLLLIDAIAWLRCHGWSVTLNIMGDGPLKSIVESRAARLRLSQAVSLLGWVPDPRVVLSQFDLYAHISLQEGLPLSLLEAMSLGIPSVASSVGGIPEIVENEVSGLLVANSRNAIAGALERVMTDRQLAGDLSLNGRARAARYLWPERVTEYIGLYQNLLEGGANG